MPGGETAPYWTAYGPAARVPCGCGCSRAAPAAGGYRQSAGQRGTMPGETEGWAPGSWRGAWGPRLRTSAAAVPGWPCGGPGLLLLLLPAGAVGAGPGWQLGG